MKRNSDSDVAMRAAVNTIIVNENSGTIDSMAEQLTNVWQTHFQGSENNTGDLDAVAVLYKLMEKYIPGETYTAEAKDLVDLLDNELAPVYTLYDLNLYGPQFDIIPFLTQARTVAQSRPLHVVFRPCLDGSYVKADKYSNDEAIFRMEHICLPACTLYGATSTVLPKPSSPMPEGEWLEGITPKPWGVLDAYNKYGRLIPPKSTPRAKELVTQFTKCFDKPIVSITLRSTFRNTARNSPLNVWLAVAETINQKYQPIFIPDTSNAFDIWEHPYPVFPAGAIDLDCRLAMYELSVMNLFTSSGPASLGWYGDIPFMVFSQGIKGNLPPEQWLKGGVPIGTQRPYSVGRQKIIWERETVETVLQEFKMIMLVDP